MSFGNKVLVIMKDGSKRCYRNVTEIHYNYISPLKYININSIAFESDIHGTGLTVFIDRIDEFETELEIDKQPNFDDEGE